MRAPDPLSALMRWSFAATAVALALAPTLAQAQLVRCADQRTFRPAPFTWNEAAPMGGLKPAPGNDRWCTHGVSLALPGGATVWRCLVVRPEGVAEPPPTKGADGEDVWAPAHHLLVAKPGARLQVFDDDVMAGRHDGFHVTAVDLDGRGGREWVLAAWNGQGNGMGVNFWTVRVFSPDWRLLATFADVADWGETSLVAAPAGRRGCDLAITSFLEGRDARRGPGAYFHATFHRLSGDAVAPATDRPARSRRYTHALARQRAADRARSAWEDRSDVAAWLNGPGAFAGAPAPVTAPR
jgi:hypothetical protein